MKLRQHNCAKSSKHCLRDRKGLAFIINVITMLYHQLFPSFREEFFYFL